MLIMHQWNLQEYCEIEVNSIDQIYNIINAYNEQWDMPKKISGGEFRAFYRGQSDAIWEIEPSIVRSDINERDQYLKYQSKLQGKSLFDQLAYLQHYETGTRLIDFTTDPKVALYFACVDNKERDAALYLYNYVPHQAEWIDTIIFTEIMLMPNDRTIKLGEFAEELYDKYEIFHERFERLSDLSAFMIAYLNHGYMVLPNEDSSKSNLRMARQKGTFFICGVKFANAVPSYMRTSMRAAANELICHSVNVPDSLKNKRPLVKIIIKREYKEKILERLEKEGITREYLFPEGII